MKILKIMFHSLLLMHLSWGRVLALSDSDVAVIRDVYESIFTFATEVNDSQDLPVVDADKAVRALECASTELENLDVSQWKTPATGISETYQICLQNSGYIFTKDKEPEERAKLWSKVRIGTSAFGFGTFAEYPHPAVAYILIAPGLVKYFVQDEEKIEKLKEKTAHLLVKLQTKIFSGESRPELKKKDKIFINKQLVAIRTIIAEQINLRKQSPVESTPDSTFTDSQLKSIGLSAALIIFENHNKTIVEEDAEILGLKLAKTIIKAGQDYDEAEGETRYLYLTGNLTQSWSEQSPHLKLHGPNHVYERVSIGRMLATLVEKSRRSAEERSITADDSYEILEGLFSKTFNDNKGKE